MESNKSTTKLDYSFNKFNGIKPNKSSIKIKLNDPNKNNENKSNSDTKSVSNENKNNTDSKNDSNKNRENKNDTDSKNGSKITIKSKESSYLNSTPTGEDSTELSDYYSNEQKEKDKEKIKIKESQKNYDEEQKDIIKSFSFKDFKKPSKVSLENDGNVTYMNCVIQCLSNFKFMICYYLNNLNEIKNKLYKMPLSYALSRIIFHLNPYPQNNLQKSFSISSFHKTVSRENTFLKGKTEKDPKDFIVFLLNKLHEEDRNEMDQKNKNNDNDNDNDTKTSIDNSNLLNYLNYLRENEHSIIFDNFCSINRTLKICSICNSKFFTYQRFFTYDLALDFDNGNNDNSINCNINIDNIINKNSVKNLIEKQMTVKDIFNYCQRCKKKTKFRINKSIIFFPNVFIIVMDKSNKNSQLNIDEEMELGDEEEKIKYQLNGMIAYNESNHNFKYIAYCLNSIDNKWYIYDDQNKVSSIDKKEFLNNNFKSELLLPPTILFYQKIFFHKKIK